MLDFFFNTLPSKIEKCHTSICALFSFLLLPLRQDYSLLFLFFSFFSISPYCSLLFLYFQLFLIRLVQNYNFTALSLVSSSFLKVQVLQSCIHRYVHWRKTLINKIPFYFRYWSQLIFRTRLFLLSMACFATLILIWVRHLFCNSHVYAKSW